MRAAAKNLQAEAHGGDPVAHARALLEVANCAINLGDYVAALDYLHEAEDKAEPLGDTALTLSLLGQMGHVLCELGDFDAALRCDERAMALAPAGATQEQRLMAHNGIGCTLSRAGRHEEALRHLQIADGLIRSLQGIPASRHAHFRSQSLADLATAYMDAGCPAEALSRAREGLEIALSSNKAPLAQLNHRQAGRALLALGEAALALEHLEAAVSLARDLTLPTQESRAQFDRAEALAAVGRSAEAYEACRAALGLEREEGRQAAARRLESRQARREIEAARLEAASAERVLNAVLPGAIARRVRAGEIRIADELPQVSVLFADIVGFTSLARRLSPAALLLRLEAVFSRFDELTEAAGLHKIKTIGDAYMAVGGALDEPAGAAGRTIALARGMLAALADEGHAGDMQLSLRVGIHCGPAIGGVIGRQRLSYDLWGDTVNTASRLESTGEPGRIHVSQAVVDATPEGCSFEPRGKIELKGIGPLATFYVR